jgi:hypothetical protein
VNLDPIVTEYTICPLPEGDIDQTLFLITVNRRPNERWVAACRQRYPSADGEWDWPPQDGDDLDEWRRQHWHDFDTAVRLAQEALPKMRINGYTVETLLAAKAAGVLP